MFDSVKAVSMAKTFVFLEFPEEEKKIKSYFSFDDEQN
jgi:hypothetical protein